MKVSIPYGQDFIQIDVPEDSIILTKKESYPAIDVSKELSYRLEGRLESFRNKKVAIAIPDITRYNISTKVLPTLVEELGRVNVGEIKLLIGSGLHRIPSQEDIKFLIPPLPIDTEVILHNSMDDSDLIYLGETSRGTPIFINRHFVEADKKIVIGTIEPHQFTGFSGGAKGVVIGLGGYKTIKKNHSFLASENARLGILEGNPVREDIDEAGKIVGIDLMINGIINEKKEIIGVFVGDIVEEYKRGVRFVKKISTVESPEVDIAIVSPGGFPKDIDMYQSQKALAHAENIVRDGGIIILIAECIEGVGNNLFLKTMQEVKNPQELVEKFKKEGFEMGKHKAFLLCRTLERVKVFVISKLPNEVSQKLFLIPFSSVEKALKAAQRELGEDSKIAILPNASSIIPVKRGGVS